MQSLVHLSSSLVHLHEQAGFFTGLCLVRSASNTSGSVEPNTSSGTTLFGSAFGGTNRVLELLRRCVDHSWSLSGRLETRHSAPGPSLVDCFGQHVHCETLVDKVGRHRHRSRVGSHTCARTRLLHAPFNVVEHLPLRLGPAVAARSSKRWR